MVVLQMGPPQGLTGWPLKVGFWALDIKDSPLFYLQPLSWLVVYGLLRQLPASITCITTYYTRRKKQTIYCSLRAIDISCLTKEGNYQIWKDEGKTELCLKQTLLIEGRDIMSLAKTSGMLAEEETSVSFGERKENVDGLSSVFTLPLTKKCTMYN